jgi:hypothetical protein
MNHCLVYEIAMTPLQLSKGSSADENRLSTKEVLIVGACFFAGKKIGEKTDEKVVSSYKAYRGGRLGCEDPTNHRTWTFWV